MTLMMKVSWLNSKVIEAYAYQLSDRKWLFENLFLYCLTRVTSFVLGNFATATTGSRKGKITTNTEDNLEMYYY